MKSYNPDGTFTCDVSYSNDCVPIDLEDDNQLTVTVTLRLPHRYGACA